MMEVVLHPTGDCWALSYATCLALQDRENSPRPADLTEESNTQTKIVSKKSKGNLLGVVLEAKVPQSLLLLGLTKTIPYQSILP